MDELSELIIPADDHSPGAKAANVAPYIDSQLAEAWDETGPHDVARGPAPGRAAVAGSRTARRSCSRLPEQRRRRADPDGGEREQARRRPEEMFFVELKSRVVQAYYTSEIGIKQEMEYKGNTYLAEFVGIDVS